MENPQRISLQKMQKSYKLTVTQELEKKIRFFCEKLPVNEWSGTVFYIVEGSFANDDLHIICKDFFLQDIGSAVFTEFKDDINVASYIATHDLTDCYTGVLHSHNKMATNFSGTDMNTLEVEGTSRNHFLSLIVNNSGNYTARITKKVTCITKGKNSILYKTFGDTTIENREVDFEEKNDYIEYYDLDISVEKLPEVPKSELELRLEEVKANANSYINNSHDGFSKRNSSCIPYNSTSYANSYNLKEPSQIKQLSLFGEQEDLNLKEETVSANPEEFINYEEAHINPKLIKDAVTQIITGDIFSVYKQNIDIDKWATNMESLYKKRFIEDTVETDSFMYWVDTFIEFLENELFDDDLYVLGRDYMDAIWAYNVINELQKYPTNKYLQAFIESLERFLL